ncbi:phage minor capsid protein [Nonomuraea sp. B19D2]|uniref:phage minor capsid protein n=1 Tax=Nonomuraea sp. B19D2 TaxID=3159561 RepID=UPI0032D9C821
MTTSMADLMEEVGQRIALAAAISYRYAEAEEHLFEVIAKALAKGRDAPQQASARLAEIQALGLQAEKILKDLEALAAQAIEDGVTKAWQDGFVRASEELEQLGEDQGISPGKGLAELLKDALELLPPLTTGALRQVNDIYRQVIAETTPLALTGAMTREQATTRALQKFAAKGITFFDGKNRNWSISSYAEMAARTAMARAANEGHLATLRENGRDLVMVSRAPYTCPLCDPWEGKVLTQSGAAGDRQEKNVLTGEPMTVHVAGTVAQARAAGLQHPNCKHTFGVYLPGMTKPPPKVEAKGTYEDTQQQRYLERQIRGWKRRAAAAPAGSPEKKVAEQHAKAYQAQMKEHLDKTGLLRQRSRERVRPDETTPPDLHPSLRPPKPDRTPSRDPQPARARQAEDPPRPVVSHRARTAIDDAKAALPSNHAAWIADRKGRGNQGYITDPSGQRRPSRKYEEHLDTVLAAGRALLDDVRDAFDRDPQLRRLREREQKATGYQRTQEHQAVARREKQIIQDLLADLRPMGGKINAEKARPSSVISSSRVYKAPDDWDKLLAEAAQHFPADWHDRVDRDAPAPLRVVGSERAYFDYIDDVMALPTKPRRYDGAFADQSRETTVHEMGHRMERYISGLRELEYTFVRRRATNRAGVLERQRDMHDIYKYYSPGREYTYEDQWANAYAGKAYVPEGHPDPASGYSEVFQVGLQDLYGRSNIRFDHTDELQAFTFGILAVL